MGKTAKLPREEKDLLDSFESGEWKSVKNKNTQIM